MDNIKLHIKWQWLATAIIIGLFLAGLIITLARI